MGRCELISWGIPTVYGRFAAPSTLSRGFRYGLSLPEHGSDLRILAMSLPKLWRRIPSIDDNVSSLVTRDHDVRWTEGLTSESGMKTSVAPIDCRTEVRAPSRGTAQGGQPGETRFCFLCWLTPRSPQCRLISREQDAFTSGSVRVQGAVLLHSPLGAALPRRRNRSCS